MNLIEIAEDLKDVPDQYLMQEIQQPTGNFPSYLVVSELSRRKRMREKVAKEMPTQTVAEELATPQPQMPPQMPQGMPQAGLMAMPQAQTELAAQDAMGTTPPEMMMPTQQMAGGGMVSFKQGGDVIRAFNGLPEGMFPEAPSDSDGPGLPSVIEKDPSRFIPGISGMLAPSTIYFAYMTPEEQAIYERTGVVPESAKKKYVEAQIAQRNPVPAAQAAPAATPVDNRALLNQADSDLRSQPGEPPPPAGPTLRDQLSQVLSSGLPAPPVARYTPAGLPAFASAEERNAARERKIAEFEQAIPDRATSFYQEDIARREKDIEGRRESNINQALIRAGLGIAKKGVIAGAGEGLDSYQQGEKDIRQSREAMFAARAKMIESQTLRDQGKFAAGKEARAEAKEDYDRALSLYNTVDSQRYRQASLQSQNYGNQLNAAIQQQRLGLEALRLQRESELDPTRKALLEAQIKQAEASAEAALRGKPLGVEDMIVLRGIAEANLKKRNQPVTDESIAAEVARLRSLSSVGTSAPTSADYSSLMGS